MAVFEAVSHGQPSTDNTDVKAATFGDSNVPSVGQVHKKSLITPLTDASAPVRLVIKEYRHPITSIWSSGPNDELPLNDPEHGTSPHFSMDSGVLDNTSTDTDATSTNAKEFEPSGAVNTESSRPAEHHKNENTILDSSTTVASAHSSRVTSPSIGSVSDQLAAAIVERLEAVPGSTHPTFRLRLDPRELGTVDVHLSIIHDVVSIRFVAQDEAARQVIDRQLNDLKQSLTNSGILFSGCHVGCNSDSRHPPDQKELPVPSYTPIARGLPRWSRAQDHDLPMTLLNGGLNFVA